MGGSSGFWKTILLPPIFALLLYVLTSYLILPIYYRLRARSNYTLLSSSLSPPSPEAIPFARGLVGRLSTLFGHRCENYHGPESLLGDEELEEGFGDLSHSVSAEERNERIARGMDVGSERRLSQELERGFMDSSDEEEDDRRRLRR